MISLQQAQQLILQQARSFGKEIVLLEESVGRVLQEPVIADRDYPPFNRATMDGIAISSTDWNNGIRSYTVAETIFAGSVSQHTIGKGQCYKIMTGAAVPLCADTVIRKEDIQEGGGRLSVTVSEVLAGQNIAVKGSDIKKETVIIQPPAVITPGMITTLASLGYDEVKVASLPSVAVVTTGDEVVPVDAPVNDVQIRNSNQPLLKALLQKWKIKPAALAHLKDDEQQLLQIINRCKRNDIIILSGAVSAGDADFVPSVLESAGAQKIFHRVAIRPGKPIWFGRFPNGAIVFALPGNPFSTFVTFRLFIDGFLNSCFGLPQKEMLCLPLNGTRTKKTDLDEFFPVAISGHPSVASPLPFNTSGDITALLQAEGIGWHPADKKIIGDQEIIRCVLL